MYQMFTHSEAMNAAAYAEAMFSCANHTALILDAGILASILFSLLGLRLRGLLLGNDPHLKDAAPTFA